MKEYKNYNFDKIIDHKGRNGIKHNLYEPFFGSNDLLPMWVADMDFETPDFIMDAIIKRASTYPVLGYFHHADEFYDLFIGWMKKRHQWEIKREWISFSPGLVTGLAMIVQAFTQPGDKVIVQPPVYNPFFSVIKDQGRILLENPLVIEEGRYKMDYEDLEQKLKDGAKMIILCSPHNPVARCWTQEELRRLGELCLRYNCLVVSDEIHSDLIMPGHTHTPMAKLSSEIAKNTITCISPGKTFNIAGLSTSNIVIPDPELFKKYESRLEQMHLQSGNVFGDEALIAAYTHGEEWLKELLAYLDENVRFAKEYLKNNLPLLKMYDHEATYLLWLDFRAYQLSREELNHRMVSKGKLALNEGALYGNEGSGFLRMNLACPKATVEEALKRIVYAINE